MNDFKFRFGTLKSAEMKTSETGVEFARFAIDAGKFTAYGIAFDASVIKAIMEAPVGEKINAGGYIDANTVETGEGEKTYLTLVTRWVKIGDAEPVKAAKKGEAPADTAAASETSDEIQPDDLTKIKGIGAAAAERLNKLGYMTYAQLAAATAEEQAVLDAEVPAIKGALTRSDVFGQAAKMAA